MERLTERKFGGIVSSKREKSQIHCSRFCNGCSQGTGDCDYVREMVDKLANYEDKQEQGLLIELPCKVGDTVYTLRYKPCHREVEYPDSYECCDCEDDCDLEKEIYEFKVPSLDWVLQHMKHFGNRVWFLTRSEAEEALEKMG